MSADNGIYVLKTGTENEIDFEYRVVHAQAIENLYYDIATGDHGKNFTPEEAFAYFKECQVFYDEEPALAYAHRLAEQHEILEYGVCILDHRDQIFQAFTSEEMEAYDRKNEADITAYRQQRDTEAQRKRNEATVRLTPGARFCPTAVYGYYQTVEGERVHGQLSGEGVEEMIVATFAGAGIDFLPSDWNER